MVNWFLLFQINQGDIFPGANYTLTKLTLNVLVYFLVFQAKSEEEVNSQKAWLDAEKVWVVHKAGFSGGRVQKVKTVREEDETPMCKVKLDHGGEIITIEEDSVEKVC